MDKRSKKMIISKLESIIGNSFYNASIQNWGPNYERYSDGREFRYPITFLDKDKNKNKCRNRIDPSMPMEQLLTGHYACGANHIYIIEALEKVIDYLEKNHGLIANEAESGGIY